MSKKNKPRILQDILIEEMVTDGKCLARFQDLIIFVQGVAPGDRADLRIIKHKKNYAEAVPLAIKEFSPLRIEPFCEHFGVCGGCKWQHLDYPTQLQFKQKQVTDALQRIGKVELPEISPIEGSELVSHYRNKLEFTFSNDTWLTTGQIATGQEFDKRSLGFHIPGRFDKIIDLQNCYLQPSPSNQIRSELSKYVKAANIPFFDLVKQDGYLRNLIIRTAVTGQVMVILQVAQDNDEYLIPVMEFLSKRFPEITSLQYIINNKKNETYHDLEVVCYKGLPYIEEQMEDLYFRVGPKSFYQTNSLQAVRLYQITRELAGLTGNEVVYDLYTGAGTIACFVARNAKKVVGIEYVPSAIDDAKINAAANNIGNCRFYAGDMADVLTDDLVLQHGKPDVIITDPPRAGMHEKVVKQLLKIAAPRIVYVSCNPGTQARDLALLDELYKVIKVQPVDMFPQTHHVENVVLLELRNK